MTQPTPSELTTQQITDLLWQVKGTPAAQPLYAELSDRPFGEPLTLDDPDWQAKFSAQMLGQPVSNP
jgi:hypothetical protein